MAAGHIVAGRCVDVAASADAYFTNFSGAAIPGSPPLITVFDKGVTGWQALTYQGSTLVDTSPLTVPTFPSCDTTAEFFDGLAIGWLVVAAMVGAYAVHLLRRAL